MFHSKKEKVYLMLILLFAIASIGLLFFGSSQQKQERAVPPAVSDAVSKPFVRKVERVVEVEKLVEVEKEITASALQDGLRDMGQLITQEYYFTEVVSFSSVKKFLSTDISLPFTESSYLASYDGTVLAGLDFSKIRVEKNDTAHRITVRLPQPAIINVTIDPNSFELYSEKAGLGNPLSAKDFNKSLVELENAARAKAIERGVLTKADANARKLIFNFVSGILEPGTYTVEFAKA